MAIFTPRGLKVRLPIDFAFALIARLYPKYDAFKVLRITEAIELMPKALSAVAGIICFLMGLEWTVIAGVVFVTTFLAHLLNITGLIFLRSLIHFSKLYSLISGYGIVLIGIIALGYFTVGWEGIVAFFAAKWAAGLLAGLLNNIQSKKFHKATGLAVTASERHFFYAYQFYAKNLGIDANLEVDDDELEESNWQPVFMDLAKKWPEVVARFKE